MPQLGETVTEGTITRWLKAVGDPVARDEPLFEVSTDKVDSEVPSPAAGVVTELRVAEGDTVDVGTVVAVVADGAAMPAQPQADLGAAPGASPPPPVPAMPVPSTSLPESALPAASAPPPESAHVPPTIPAPPPFSPPSPPMDSADPVAQAPSSIEFSGSTAPAESAAAMRVLSPVVRRLLSDNSIDPEEVSGTGVGGRITRGDVLGRIDSQRTGLIAAIQGGPTARQVPSAPPLLSTGAATPPPPPPPPPVSVSTSTPSAPAGISTPVLPPAAAQAGTDEVIPFTNIRRRTAEHMIRSQATSAHALVVLEADFENVEQVRRANRERFKSEEGFSLTYLPFVARATVEALREWPNLNASVGDDALIVHHGVNLGIAVDLNHQGLIVPVVHRAEELTLRGMARRISELARKARERQLSADDIAGGTFSITNPGPFGTLLTYPVINQPQVGIVSTDGIKRKPVVITSADGTEAIAIHSVGLLSLAWDHRAVDGAYAAAFVARVTELIATHDWAAEL